MAYHYSNPKREHDPHALPDIEIWEEGEGSLDRYGEPVEPGWYWHACFPGCLPDGEPSGPFATEAEALADARESYDDDEREAETETRCRHCGQPITPDGQGSWVDRTGGDGCDDLLVHEPV